MHLQIVNAFGHIQRTVKAVGLLKKLVLLTDILALQFLKFVMTKVLMRMSV